MGSRTATHHPAITMEGVAKYFAGEIVNNGWPSANIKSPGGGQGASSSSQTFFVPKLVIAVSMLLFSFSV